MIRLIAFAAFALALATSAQAMSRSAASSAGRHDDRSPLLPLRGVRPATAGIGTTAMALGPYGYRRYGIRHYNPYGYRRYGYGTYRPYGYRPLRLWSRPWNCPPQYPPRNLR